MSIEVRKKFVEREKRKTRELYNFLFKIRKQIRGLFILNDKERERLMDIIDKQISSKLPKRMKNG
ncbi:MAG: hypothetical protein AABY22_09830 [Nanoarchaeota archaeon]